MNGVETELGRMQSSADEAARIGGELLQAVRRLDSALEGGLGSMSGQIKNAFWQGRNTHIEAVEGLCAKLRQMSEGISTSQKLYETHDGESQATFAKFSGGGAIDVSKLA